jgi:hypothetical protein
VHSLATHYVIDEMASDSSLCIIKLNRFIVLMTTIAEKPVAHKCVVTNGSKTFIALSDKLV